MILKLVLGALRSDHVEVRKVQSTRGGIVTQLAKAKQVNSVTWSHFPFVLSSSVLLCSPHFVRFFTGLALLQQEHKASEDTHKEAACFLQQGLEHFISQCCCIRCVCVCMRVRAATIDYFDNQ